MSTAVVVVAWNGRQWLPGLFGSLGAQTVAPDEVIVVDNGSTDGTVEWVRSHAPDAVVVELGANTGFAAGANRGIEAASSELVALVNTDVELAADWVERMVARLRAEPDCCAGACKMVRLADPAVLDDAGDVLRRDGVCEQRGRGWRDDGRWDASGEVFGACAGAALYRRAAVLEVGGFDERYFTYLEDVDLALRLRLAGWRCAYEPAAVARHAAGGSSGQLARPVGYWTARNTLLLVAKYWPWRWAPFVAYRQAAWIWHAARGRRLGEHLRGVGAGLRRVPAMLRERPTWRAQPVRVEAAVPRRPWRGPQAGGHLRAGF